MCCPQVQDKWRGEVVELSWEPRAFLFKKFMSDEECDSIIAKVLRYLLFFTTRMSLVHSMHSSVAFA